MVLSLLFDGRVWAQELGYGQPGDIEVTHTYSQNGGGLDSLKFKMAFSRNYSNPVLKAGKKVEVFRGPIKLGTATLSDPNPDDWSFEAEGLFRRAERFDALRTTFSGVTTIDLRGSVTAGNARMLGWNGFGNLPVLTVSEQSSTEQVGGVTIADVLNSYCVLTGKRWGLDANDVPFVADDPVTPTWALNPGIPLMPKNDDTSVSVVHLTYRSGGTPASPVLSTVTAGAASFDGHEVNIDTTNLGQLTAPQAQAYADNYLAVNGVRVTYGGGIDIRPGDLTNTGSVPITNWHSPLSVLGQRGLHHGVVDKALGSLGKTITWVCGSTVYKDDPTGGSLQIYPIDLSPRVLSSVIRDLTRVAEQSAAREQALVNATER